MFAKKSPIGWVILYDCAADHWLSVGLEHLDVLNIFTSPSSSFDALSSVLDPLFPDISILTVMGWKLIIVVTAFGLFNFFFKDDSV